MDWDPVAEVWNLAARFVYASRGNVPDFVIVPAGTHAGTYRIISDHLGSPRLIVDIENGLVKQEIAYDEWGKETGLRTNADFPNPFTFAGGLYDADTKLIRFGARDYDPETGRWTAKDPIRFDGDGPNLYGYTSNDPVNFVDPWGLKPKGAYRLMDNAAIDALNEAIPLMLSDPDPRSREYFGSIIQLPDGNFTYTAPERGHPGWADTGYVPGEVANYHTHPKTGNLGDFFFSPQDKERTIPQYLGTWTFKIKKWAPNYERPIVIQTPSQYKEKMRNKEFCPK